MNKIITTTFPGKYKTHYDLTGRNQYHRAVKAIGAYSATSCKNQWYYIAV